MRLYLYIRVCVHTRTCCSLHCSRVGSCIYIYIHIYIYNIYIHIYVPHLPPPPFFSLFPGCCGMYYVLVATGHSHREPGESASDPHEHTNVSKVYLRRNVGTPPTSTTYLCMYTLPRGKTTGRTGARRSSCTRTSACCPDIYVWVG